MSHGRAIIVYATLTLLVTGLLTWSNYRISQTDRRITVARQRAASISVVTRELASLTARSDITICQRLNERSVILAAEARSALAQINRQISSGGISAVFTADELRASRRRKLRLIKALEPVPCEHLPTVHR